MKSNIHRRSHCSGWGQANLRGLYPTFKARYKHDSNHRVRIADCMLAADELQSQAQAQSHHWSAAPIAYQDSAHCNEQEQADIEQQRYRAWLEGAEYPREDYYYYEYDRDYGEPSYFDSVGFEDMRWDTLPVYAIGDYKTTVWNTDVYHVERHYTFVGSIRLDSSAMRWHVDFVPAKGEQTHYEFDYLDTSIEAASALLVMMDRLDQADGGAP